MTATVTWRAPGRVNLIGEHTDYNLGFALPMAITQGCTASVDRLDVPVLQITSAQREDSVDVPLAGLAPGGVEGWAGYVAGVVWELQRRCGRLPGLRIHVDGDVPLGAGLSSSAALACSVAAGVDDLLTLGISPLDQVAVTRVAENDFVGAPTGGMDQLASVLSVAGHALLCDMRTLETEAVPFDLDAAGLTLLIADTQAPHRHADGEYRARREACEQAAGLLGVASLRDVQDADHPTVLDALAAAAGASGLDADAVRVLVRRTRHILTENARVLAVADLLRGGTPAEIGPLLTQSHESMKADFEITVDEVDTAVAVALGAGALGSRMTGGGFGGCVISLVRTADADAVGTAITSAFARAGYREPILFTAVASQGAHRL